MQPGNKNPLPDGISLNDLYCKYKLFALSDTLKHIFTAIPFKNRKIYYQGFTEGLQEFIALQTENRNSPPRGTILTALRYKHRFPSLSGRLKHIFTTIPFNKGPSLATSMYKNLYLLFKNKQIFYKELELNLQGFVMRWAINNKSPPRGTFIEDLIYKINPSIENTKIFPLKEKISFTIVINQMYNFLLYISSVVFMFLLNYK